MCAELLQLCPALWNPIDCSLPGSSVHGVLQARILEWVAMPSSRGASWSRDQTQVSCVAYIGRWVNSHYCLWKTISSLAKTSCLLHSSLYMLPKNDISYLGASRPILAFWIQNRMISNLLSTNPAVQITSYHCYTLGPISLLFFFFSFSLTKLQYWMIAFM